VRKDEMVSSGSDDSMLEVDLVVIGAGMAGLTIAATVSEAGLSVAVIDVADHAGGSALLSEGYVWTAPSTDVFRWQDPEGDVERFEIMLAGLPAALDWVASLGVLVGGQLERVLGYGTGRQIDVREYLRRCLLRVERNGVFLRETTVKRINVAETGLAGVTVADADGDVGTISARAVVLSTGGFQADRARRLEWLHPNAGDLLVRSNEFSTGGGLLYGLEAGADLSGPTDGFYGHLMPYPLSDFSPADYAALAQYHSEHGILLDRSGRRFTDESLGDHINTVEVAAIGRALLIVDERIRRDEVLRPFIQGMDVVDKMAVAGSRGANYASADSLDALFETVSTWGYDASAGLATVRSFNAAIESGEDQVPPRSTARSQLIEPPFAALEVQAAITFTYRGLTTDAHGRVMGATGVVPGLYAGGADAGGLYHRGYVGGLVRGLSLGRDTGMTIVADLGGARV